MSDHGRPVNLNARVVRAAESWRSGERVRTERSVAQESAVALVYDGSTQAVMMATPADLEDFALGFSFTEGMIDRLDQVRHLEIVPGELGIEARIWLDPDCSVRAATRRRAMAGPTGCGLCGVESLEAVAQARRSSQPLGALRLSPEQVLTAVAALEHAQPLGAATRAVHAAGFWRPDRGLVAAREDVGRHNALDKLAGSLLRAGEDPSAGVLALTSRVSVEMVQKAVAFGVPWLIAISAPTDLALRTAESAGLTVAAVARHDGFELFTGRQRVIWP